MSEGAEIRPAPDELKTLLAAMRPDWPPDRIGEVVDAMGLDPAGWPWARVVRTCTDEALDRFGSLRNLRWVVSPKATDKPSDDESRHQWAERLRRLAAGGGEAGAA